MPVEFSIDSKKGFILSGRQYPLRGVSRHQNRWAIGNALKKEHHDEDMELICGLTVLRFTGMLGMRNVSFTKEELVKMNAIKGVTIYLPLLS